jgi:hypothetical protein
MYRDSSPGTSLQTGRHQSGRRATFGQDRELVTTRVRTHLGDDLLHDFLINDQHSCSVLNGYHVAHRVMTLYDHDVHVDNK